MLFHNIFPMQRSENKWYHEFLKSLSSLKFILGNQNS